MRFPIRGLLGEIGTVSIEQQGLYYSFIAEIKRTAGVPRLWFHGCRSVRLAAFAPDGANMKASGKISCRSLSQTPQSGTFSILDAPWHVQTVPGFSVPITALKTDDGFLAAFPLRGDLPDDALSRVCFFERKVICGEACWQLALNLNGDPVFIR